MALLPKRGLLELAYASCLPSLAAFRQQNLPFFAPKPDDGISTTLKQFPIGSRSFSAEPEPTPSDPSEAIAKTLRETTLEEEEDLTPKRVVEKLDRFIVGQNEAKRAVAVALRNRWRRHKIPAPFNTEVVPKNILMIGPTGCGKTEIARRLAKLANAPFVKVEATKFTEVGFHGRDVDQIIRDLVDNAVMLMKQTLRKKLKKEIETAVEDAILEKLVGHTSPGGRDRESFRRLLRDGHCDDQEIEFEPGNGAGRVAVDGPFPQEGFPGFFVKFDKIPTQKQEKRKMKIKEVKPLLEEQEFDRIVPQDVVQREAIKAVEQDGIVFIDEIDKIVVGPSQHYGADASSEGVQRDLLPIIEGSVVSSKYGNVNTDHILFICSGAFHHVKPSDMLAELQGRLPIRVELKGLTKEDFYRILTEPEMNMIKQQQALLGTEGIQLHFTDASINEISRVAEEVNKTVDNIGARRLHTVLERIVEEISFNAPELASQAKERGQETHQHVVDKEDVTERVGDLLKKVDLSKYIL